jgi:uncharacterized protein YkwD
LVLALTAKVIGVSALKTTMKVANAASYLTARRCTSANINLTTSGYRSLYLHNQTRACYGLVGFCAHPSLQNAAYAYSAEMISKYHFSHNSYSSTSGTASADKVQS